MSIFDHCDYSQHEQVHFVSDKSTGLNAIIAVHDTRLGPAVGGCRIHAYPSSQDALSDALRLSQAMTYKNVLAGLPFGGGKSVIIADPQTEKTSEMLEVFGTYIDQLGGKYIAAEDSGTSPSDMAHIAKTTQHVAGLSTEHSDGDPSPATARGVLVSIQTAAEHKLGRRQLEGLSVVVQGLGHVGFELAKLLMREGAIVYGSDANQENLNRAAQELEVHPVDVNSCLSMPCDILAPCALGGVLNEHNIPNLATKIVAGAANNQLATPQDAIRLADRGILYCPDFLINSGGILDIYHRRTNASANVILDAEKSFLDRLTVVLETAARHSTTPYQVASHMAEQLREMDTEALLPKQAA